MSNPYAPPETREEGSREAWSKDSTLRRLGAISVAYILVRVLLNSFPDLPTKLTALALMGAFIYGFLRGGRKYQLGIALFMGLCIWVQAYFMNRAIAHPERLPIQLSRYPWLEFAASVIPHAIALLCAAALYVRARRTAAS